jgi:DNA-binding beta-propeller fold protein YncE
MRASARIILVAALACGCGSRGAVTFVIHDADDSRMRPDPALVSEYLIKGSDGTLIGVASVNPSSPTTLPLGPLVANTMPQDLILSVLNGSELLEMARVRGVSITAGREVTYTAEVRKPLVFVGAAVPSEPGGTKVANATQILDGNNDLAHPLPTATNKKAVVIPDDIQAGAVTSDGRFLLAGRANALTPFDTSKAAVVGDLKLPFTPVGVATAARDVAAAAIGGSGADGQVVVISDVATLVSNPAAATSSGMATLRGQQPRKAAFSPDGQKLYVLTGGTSVLDPCDGTAPPSNGIVVLGLDGNTQVTWSLSSFAADLAVDPASGAIYVSLPGKNEVGSIDPSSAQGPVSPVSLFPATCPAAIAVQNGQILAVTGGQDPVLGAGTFVLAQHSTQAGGAPTTIALPTPVFAQPEPPPTASGPNWTQLIQVLPKNINGYEVAITPDGTRAVFGSRTHYQVLNGDLGFNACKLNYDVVEYGMYDVDLRSGAAAYEKRSLLQNTMCEADCVDILGNPMNTPCSMLLAGDRVSGVAAVFGGP